MHLTPSDFFQSISNDFDLDVSHGPGKKPRIVLVQPQRLFHKALERMLAPVFEIVDESVASETHYARVDLVLVDADAVQLEPSPALWLNGSNAAVCFLVLAADHPSHEFGTPASCHVIPKRLNAESLLEILERIAVLSRTFDATSSDVAAS